MKFNNLRNLGMLSIIINFLSVYNIIFGIWSIIMLILAWFIYKNSNETHKLNKDKKITAYIQTFMASVFMFLSTVMGGIGIYMFYLFLRFNLSNYVYYSNSSRTYYILLLCY